jgi:Domain of unknown function (DUF4382)
MANMTKRIPSSILTPTAVLAFLVVVTGGLLTASCGGPTSPSGNSNLRLMLTDAPIDDVEEVNIFFTSVTAKPVGQPPIELELVLDPQDNPMDLLTLDDKVIGFATGVVTPGDFEYIRINIDASRSNIVENSVQKPLRVPSEEIKVLGGFKVDENHLTTLTLDFDAEASLVSLGNGGWLLKPIVVVSDTKTAAQP